MKSYYSYGSIPATSSETSSDEENIRQSNENWNDDTSEYESSRSRDSKKASIPDQVANMTNSIIGGGVLSLPGGIALFANTSLFVDSSRAALWTLGLGAVFAYFCWLIGRVCVQTKTMSYRDAWIRSMGDRGSIWISIANTFDPLLGLLANASIVSQSLQLLLEGILNIYWTETQCLLIVTVVAFLPLCLLKSLKALAPFSAFSMVAVVVALVAMLIRFGDGSYQPNGTYYTDLAASKRPQTEYTSDSTTTSWTSVLPFVCMVFTSFDMHYNSPRFYADLKDTSIPRYGVTVAYSFGLASLLYMAIAVVGFLTFGLTCDSFILNNYSPRDPLATLSRLAMSLSSLLTYPLNFIGVRDNLLDTLRLKEFANATSFRRNTFTISLLALITLISCFITDLGVISAVGGGTTVTLVCFIFPACMFLSNALFKKDLSLDQVTEAVFVAILMGLSVFIGVVGTWDSVNQQQPN